MANIFTLKHGEGKPSSGVLQPYELGYAHDGFLYIGNAVKQTVGIKVDFATNAKNATNAINANNLTSILALEKGGTGASDAATARSNLGVNLTNLGLAASASELNILDGATITTAELNYVKGVTSPIQTQLNGKEPTISLTASRALVSNSSGKVAVSAITSKELGYLDGVTSNIQTQLNKKAICTLIASGKTLNSSNPSFTITGGAKYSAYIIFGYTASGTVNGYCSIFIPRPFVNKTARRFTISDVAQAKIFTLKISGEDLVVTNEGYYGGGIDEGSVYVYGLT